MDKVVVGFDVSKEWIDCAISGTGEGFRIGNDEAAICAFLAKVGPISLAAFEPTGGYERVLRRCLRQGEVVFARVHPNEVVAFRHRRGVKAKTDRLDARLIADFAAEELTRRGRGPAIETDEALRELVARRPSSARCCTPSAVAAAWPRPPRCAPAWRSRSQRSSRPWRRSRKRLPLISQRARR